MSGEPIDPEVIGPVGPTFDLPRGAHAEELAALLGRGADHARVDGSGQLTAGATAAIVDLPAMAGLRASHPQQSARGMA